MIINLQERSMMQGHLRWQYLLPCLALLMLVTGCGSRSQSTASAAFESGGLGLTKAEWEQHHTLSSNNFLQNGALGYDSKNYEVYFWNADRAFPPTAPIILMWLYGPHDHINETFVRTLLPSDAQLKDTIPRGWEGTFTQVYYSRSLSTRYAPLPLATGVVDPWKESSPGTIYATYIRGDYSVLITAGEKLSLPYRSAQDKTPIVFVGTVLPLNGTPATQPLPAAVPTSGRVVPTGMPSLPQAVPTSGPHP